MRRSMTCSGVDREACMQENEIYVHMVPLVPPLCQIVHALLNEVNKHHQESPVLFILEICLIVSITVN